MHVRELMCSRESQAGIEQRDGHTGARYRMLQAQRHVYTARLRPYGRDQREDTNHSSGLYVTQVHRQFNTRCREVCPAMDYAESSLRAAAYDRYHY